MKKIIVLIIALAGLTALGVYVNSLIKNKGKSDTELIEFKVDDVSTVDKVTIQDAFGNKFTIVKGNDGWTDENGGCIVQESVDFILEAFEKIEFKGYIEDNAADRFKEDMIAQNIQVDIYQDGEWSKTWYIGPTSQDHYSQIMLLDDAKYGKSDKPVYMKIKGMHGFISARFFADARQWMCTNIFALDIKEIKTVDVKYIDEPARSFKVDRKGNNFDVYQQDKPLKGVDTAMIYRYLQKFNKIHFNTANFVLSPEQVDSVKRSTPFCQLTVDEVDGNETLIKCHRIGGIEKDIIEGGLVEINNYDQDQFWAELPNGQLVKCQYFVFNPILFGHIYFPLDLSSIETIDGMRPLNDPVEFAK